MIAKTCKPAQNLTVSDCITIGIETGIQNVKIAVTIIFLIYKLPDQLYEFAQQLYFPLLYLGAQVRSFIFRFNASTGSDLLLVRWYDYIRSL